MRYQAFAFLTVFLLSVSVRAEILSFDTAIPAISGEMLLGAETKAPGEPYMVIYSGACCDSYNYFIPRLVLDKFPDLFVYIIYSEKAQNFEESLPHMKATFAERGRGNFAVYLADDSHRAFWETIGGSPVAYIFDGENRLRYAHTIDQQWRLDGDARPYLISVIEDLRVGKLAGRQLEEHRRWYAYDAMADLNWDISSWIEGCLANPEHAGNPANLAELRANGPATLKSIEAWRWRNREEMAARFPNSIDMQWRLRSVLADKLEQADSAEAKAALEARILASFERSLELIGNNPDELYWFLGSLIRKPLETLPKPVLREALKRVEALTDFGDLSEAQIKHQAVGIEIAKLLLQPLDREAIELIISKFMWMAESDEQSSGYMQMKRMYVLMRYQKLYYEYTSSDDGDGKAAAKEAMLAMQTRIADSWSKRSSFNEELADEIRLLPEDLQNKDALARADALAAEWSQEKCRRLREAGVPRAYERLLFNPAILLP